MEWISSSFFIGYGEADILRQHMHKKEFWILTNKCGNNLKHENEAEGPYHDLHRNIKIQ